MAEWFKALALMPVGGCDHLVGSNPTEDPYGPIGQLDRPPRYERGLVQVQILLGPPRGVGLVPRQAFEARVTRFDSEHPFEGVAEAVYAGGC